MEIQFTETAANLLISQAQEHSRSIRDWCAERFKDYQFGLKLIAQNTGQRQFTVNDDAVLTPDKVLSDWVVASYRKEQKDRE